MLKLKELKVDEKLSFLLLFPFLAIQNVPNGGCC